MVRVSVFIIALLLATEVIEPTAPWLITLAVLSGIVVFRCGRPRLPRFRARFGGRRWAEEYDW